MVDINYVRELVKKLNRKSCSFALLHTTSLYPTPNHLARLNIIDEFKTNFPKQVIGYSDHTIGNNACYIALSKGASIIEKHFIDNYRIKGPDIICSCDGKSLSKLIKKSEEIFEISNGSKVLLKEEKVTKNFAFASVCSIKDIKKGEQFSSKNIWAKRPGIGYFKANDLKSLYGKKAKQDIPKNTLIRKNTFINTNNEKIFFLTGTRADYGKIKPILQILQKKTKILKYIYLSQECICCQNLDQRRI